MKGRESEVESCLVSREDGVRCSNQTAHWNSTVSKSLLPSLHPETQSKETLHSAQSLNYIGTRICALRVLNFPHSFIHSASICFQNTPPDGIYYHQCHVATTGEDRGAGRSFDLGIDFKLFFPATCSAPRRKHSRSTEETGVLKAGRRVLFDRFVAFVFPGPHIRIPFLTPLSSALGAWE